MQNPLNPFVTNLQNYIDIILINFFISTTPAGLFWLDMFLLTFKLQYDVDYMEIIIKTNIFLPVLKINLESFASDLLLYSRFLFFFSMNMD